MMLWYMYFCALKPMGDNFANIYFLKNPEGMYRPISLENY